VQQRDMYRTLATQPAVISPVSYATLVLLLKTFSRVSTVAVSVIVVVVVVVN